MTPEDLPKEIEVRITRGDLTDDTKKGLAMTPDIPPYVHATMRGAPLMDITESSPPFSDLPTWLRLRAATSSVSSRLTFLGVIISDDVGQRPPHLGKKKEGRVTMNTNPFLRGDPTLVFHPVATDGSRPVPTYFRRKAEVPVACGRNQPCPCGSGKKYKHCHRKER